jgi:hypothetical protein
VWWLTIYLPVIRGEERYLAESFPDEYPAYRSRVPCLIPWRRPLPARGDGFRWSNPNLAGGEEFPRAVRILAYPLLFFVAEGLRSEGWEWLNSGWNLSGLAGLVMLHVLAWERHGHQRQRRWILLYVMRHARFRVVASTAVLAAVWYVSGPRTSCGDALPIAGAVLMLLSVPVYSRTPLRAVAAESLALLGVIAAGELLWLAPALVVVFAAWILDYQLGRTQSADGQSPSPAAALFWPYFYPLLAIACAAVIGVKLVGHVFPLHVF